MSLAQDITTSQQNMTQFPWQNYDLGTLAQMVKQNPNMASHLPPEVWDQFPNEVYVDNPMFVQNATSGRQQQLFTDRPELQSVVNPTMAAGGSQGLIAQGWTLDPKTGALMSPQAAAPAAPTAPPTVPATPTTPATPATPVTQPTTSGAPAPGTFTPQPEINQPGSIGAGGLTGMELTQGGVKTPLPGDISAAIQGKQMPTQQTFGNLPRFSAQSMARLLPSSRTNLSVLANRTGNRAEDFMQMGANMSRGPQGALPNYRAQPGNARGY